MAELRVIRSLKNHPIFILSAGLIALAWLVILYQQALHGPYTFDDVLIFPSTQIATLSAESVLQTLAMHNSGILGRPLAILSFILNYTFLGADPYGYKLVNLLIHFTNTCLIFFLTLRISRLIASPEQGKTGAQALIAATLCAAIWAFHPLQVSTVMYIFQRTVLLSTLFSLVAMLLYLYGRTQASFNWKAFTTLYLLFPVSLVLALSCKESGALVLPFVLVFEIVLFRFRFNGSLARNGHCGFLLLFIALPTVLALVYFASHAHGILEGYESRDFNMVERLLTEAVAIMFYLKLMLAPTPSSMSLFHDAFPIYSGMSLTVGISLATLAIMAAAVFVLKRRSPAIALGAGLFLSAHLLESTFIPLELVFEHRNYFALFGIVFPISWYLASWAGRQGQAMAALAAGAVMILLLSGQTYSRSIEWGDELLMHTLAVQNHPDSIRSRKLLVTTLSNLGRHEDARQELAEAITLNPGNPSLDMLSLATRCNAGLVTDELYTRTLYTMSHSQLRQDIPGLFNGLIQQTAAHGCEGLTLDKLRVLAEAASANPEKKMPAIFRLTLYALNAQLQMATGHADQAMEELDKALQEVPTHPEILIVQTGLRTRAGNLTRARALLDTLERVNRRTFGAYARALDSLQQALNTKVAENQDA